MRTAANLQSSDGKAMDIWIGFTPISHDLQLFNCHPLMCVVTACRRFRILYLEEVEEIVVRIMALSRELVLKLDRKRLGHLRAIAVAVRLWIMNSCKVSV